ATNGHAREARLPGLPRAKCVALCPKSCRRFELGDRHVLDCVDRKLQEAGAHRTERLGIAGGEETVGAVARRVVVDALPRERLGDLARSLLRREDERDAATEHALQDRTE